MEFTGKFTDVAIDYKTGKAKLTLLLNEKQDVLACYDELHMIEKLSVEIKKFRKKRSLDANALFWVMCGKLAEHTGQEKTDVYRHLIREIGGNYEVLPIKNEAVDKFVEAWQHNGIGWICDVMRESKIKGYTNVCAYYGSSTYDTKQMSLLIDSVITECKEQGIQVDTPEEIEKTLSAWGQKEETAKM